MECAGPALDPGANSTKIAHNVVPMLRQTNARRSNHARRQSAPRGRFMHARFAALLAFGAALALTQASAQDAKKPVPPNPVGATGNWTQSVKKEAAIAGEEF